MKKAIGKGLGIAALTACAALSAGGTIAATASAATAATTRASHAATVRTHEAHPKTTEGCPLGDVCVYPNASWNGGHPSLFFVSIGAHNISGQTGIKRFFNNQTNNDGAHLCLGRNGTNCLGSQPAGTYFDYNFTPINSVLLTRG